MKYSGNILVYQNQSLLGKDIIRANPVKNEEWKY